MKNKILAIFALVMVFAVLCTMSVAVFADDTATAPDASADSETTGETTGDTTSESTEDATDDTASDTTGESSSETEDKTEETKEPTWWDNNNQIIGWILAAIIFVAIVLVSIWWVKSGFKPSKK